MLQRAFPWNSSSLFRWMWGGGLAALLVVGTWLLLREVEAAHVTLRDATALGEGFRRGRARAPVPLQCCRKVGGARPRMPVMRGDRVSGPVFPTLPETRIPKKATNRTLRQAVVLARSAQDAEVRFSGHNRRGLAHFGIDSATIGLLSRRSGSTILRYIRGAPLLGIACHARQEPRKLPRGRRWVPHGRRGPIRAAVPVDPGPSGQHPDRRTSRRGRRGPDPLGGASALRGDGAGTRCRPAR